MDESMAAAPAAMLQPARPATLPHATLVLGGARSGKSAYAEALVLGATPEGVSPLYIATATASDAEMAARIARHRARRGTAWRTLEVPLDLADALTCQSERGGPILVDCLTLWLTNVMLAGRDAENETAKLVDTLARLEGPLVAVSNEVGLGLVPDSRLGREFRDHLGILHQRLAVLADRVVFMTAGLPMQLKPQPTMP